MKTRFVEATNGVNWGKFMVGAFDDDEWSRRSQVDQTRCLLPACGWGPGFIWLLDLQTGEGAYFRAGGSASADLQKHAIWVCLLYEPVLEWLYEQDDPTDLDSLPAIIDLPDAPAGLYGYRRPGPDAMADA